MKRKKLNLRLQTVRELATRELAAAAGGVTKRTHEMYLCDPFPEPPPPKTLLCP